ncbi:hypothetical protein GCM10025771_39840 [Niveibacterium umoris]|uniref:Peptidase M48 domain-containing protein n=1 Tax=Niveibacterium umoris TaxID=1193620 RepID=A0A840BF53_9RHOO|nr:hypothetical protein [Niveibacterium umoris]MBB4010814.1 hypothetical protein [Niveibacterium umoris]
MKRQLTHRKATANTLALYVALAATCSATALAIVGFALATFDGVMGLVALLGALLVALLRCDAILRRASRIDGKRLDAGSYPALHRLVEKACLRTGTQAVDAIVLVPDFGVAVIQVPRLFARSRRSLAIGIELMQSVDTRTFAIAIQHALVSSHGKMGTLNWLGRQRNALSLIEQSLAHMGPDALVCRPLLTHALASHVAQTTILLRELTLGVDRQLSRGSSTRRIARAIAHLSTQERLLADFFWANYKARANTEAHPAYLPYTGIRVAVDVSTPIERQRALARALADQPNEASPIPTLRERIDGLGERPSHESTEKEHTPAAVRLLREHYAAIVTAFNRNWLTDNLTSWAEQHQLHKVTVKPPLSRQPQPQSAVAPRKSKQTAHDLRMATHSVNEFYVRSNNLHQSGAASEALAEAERWASAVISSNAAVALAH